MLFSHIQRLAGILVDVVLQPYTATNWYTSGRGTNWYTSGRGTASPLGGCVIMIDDPGNVKYRSLILYDSSLTKHLFNIRGLRFQ